MAYSDELAAISLKWVRKSIQKQSAFFCLNILNTYSKEKTLILFLKLNTEESHENLA
jgi:hypothetical protein